MYDKELFKRQVREGMTAQEQAEYWGIELSSATDRRWRLGLSTQPQLRRDDEQFIRDVKSGMKNADLADKYGASLRTINRWRAKLGVKDKNARPRLTEEQRRIIRDLATDGASASEIARTVGVAQSTIVRYHAPESAWTREQTGQYIAARARFREAERKAGWANNDTDSI